MSTLIWDAIATEHNGFVTTVDIDKKATQNCIELLGEDCVRTVVVTSDSVRYMRACEKMGEVDLLYLDSYDFDINNPLESATHHLAELASVYHQLKRGCYIMIDDCHGPDFGKHMLCKGFLNIMGARLVVQDYQHIWIK